MNPHQYNGIVSTELFAAAFPTEHAFLGELIESGLHQQDRRDQLGNKACAVLAWQEARQAPPPSTMEKLNPETPIVRGQACDTNRWF